MRRLMATAVVLGLGLGTATAASALASIRPGAKCATAGATVVAKNGPFHCGTAIVSGVSRLAWIPGAAAATTIAPAAPPSTVAQLNEYGDFRFASFAPTSRQADFIVGLHLIPFFAQKTDTAMLGYADTVCAAYLPFAASAASPALTVLNRAISDLYVLRSVPVPEATALAPLASRLFCPNTATKAGYDPNRSLKDQTPTTTTTTTPPATTVTTVPPTTQPPPDPERFRPFVTNWADYLIRDGEQRAADRETIIAVGVKLCQGASIGTMSTSSFGDRLALSNFQYPYTAADLLLTACGFKR